MLWYVTLCYWRDTPSGRCANINGQIQIQTDQLLEKLLI